MKASFILLSVADLALLLVTAYAGFCVRGTEFFLQHFLLGMLAGLFTCFVHVVFFMYFVVQEKIMKQALAAVGEGESHLRNGASATQAIKSRAFRAAMLGICAILLTVALGAAIGILVGPQVHMVSAFVAVGVNLVVFFYQYGLLGQYAEIFSTAFPEG